MAAALGALAFGGWLAVAPNRLIPGEPMTGFAALGAAAWLVAALAAGGTALGLCGRASGGTLLLLAALALALAATGLAAGEALADRPPAARATPGGGFWLALAALALLAAETARGAGAPRLLAAVALAAALALALGGVLAPLSPLVEYAARADAVADALAEHVALSAAALALALLLAVPLGLAAHRAPRVAAVAGSALDAVQVIPAIALFGLLLPVLAGLLALLPLLREAGFGAIGTTPAVLGIAAYLALPLFRATLAGLSAPDPAVVEAAEAMGFAGGRLLTEVRLPLALPVLAAGLRVAAVQAIGLATLGGLIGAGGLGALVFDGMAQFVPDLILLGALPVMALALGADLALRAAERVVTP